MDFYPKTHLEYQVLHRFLITSAQMTEIWKSKMAAILVSQSIPQNVKIYIRIGEGTKFQWGIMKDPYGNTNMSLVEFYPMG